MWSLDEMACYLQVAITQKIRSVSRAPRSLSLP